jgi:hypothetical protein
MKPTFSKSTVVMFIAAAAALFAISIIFAANEGSVAQGAGAGPGVKSTSAVGYAGLYDVLRRLDLPIASSARSPLAEAGSRGTLIIAEPIMAYLTGGGYYPGKPERLLFVLPKWSWVQDINRPEWVSSMRPAPVTEAQSTLSAVAIDGSMVFRKWVPDKWTTNIFPFDPALSGTIQMIHPSDKMSTLVGDEEGALIAELKEGGQTIWILADPDVMSNRGISNGDNAAFMANLLTSLSEIGNEDFRGKKSIIFDETVHGFRAKDDSLLSMMLSFPFAIVTILACCSAIMLAAAGAGRFGVPQTPRPVLDFGKAQLIGNSARLLDYSGHHAVTLGRYARMTINEAARTLRAPEGMNGRELADWADRVGRSRNVSVTCSTILNEIESPGTASRSDISRLVETARLAHKWKGEILNGSAVHRQRH